jgi:hypothetical protein
MCVNHIRCEHTRHGLWIRGRVHLASLNVTLNPGDTIVSVGNTSCSDTNLSLQDLIDQAYRNGILGMVIQDGYTGKRISVDLPPVEDDGDSAR